MNRAVIAGAAVIAVVVAAAVGWIVYNTALTAPAPKPVAAEEQPAPNGESGGEQTAAAAQPLPSVADGAAGNAASGGTSAEAAAEVARVQSRYYVKPEEPPAFFEEFYEWSQMQRLNKVTEAMHRKEPMDAALYAFFKAEMFNRDHWDVTRNNMANALVWARTADGGHPDPELHQAFITMLEDENEDPVWRDYCVQFLSENLPHASDKKRVTEVISRVSEGDGSLAGTAMVHMALQEQEGGMTLSEEFGGRLAEKLDQPQVHRDTRLAILGVMGKRRDVERLPLIRKYASQDENAGLKRVAIAALGTIGASPETRDSITDADRAIVEAAVGHRNRAVQMAAGAALKRMQ